MTHLEAEIVVIGSGVAGALVAYQLARAGLSVLIIEAGPQVSRERLLEKFAQTASFDLVAGYPDSDHAPSPQPDGAPAYLRYTGDPSAGLRYLRLAGGTTWHWSGGTDRLLEDDFTMYSHYGVGVDWPLRLRDLADDYIAAEKMLGVAGKGGDHYLPPILPSYADKIWQKTLAGSSWKIEPRHAARNSVPHGGRSACQGFGTCAPLCPSGAQYHAMIHVMAAQEAGARLVTDMRVDRLEADSAGHIQSAIATRPDKSRVTITGRQFILAANGLESPRLLLQSTSERYPQGLANRSGWVGRGFMDHLVQQVHFQSPQPLYSGRGPLFTQVIMNYATGEHRRRHAALRIMPYNRVALDNITQQAIRRGLSPPELAAAIRHAAAHHGQLEILVERLPDPANRLTLDQTVRDRSGLPQMSLQQRLDRYSAAGLAAAERAARRLLIRLAATDITFLPTTSAHHLLGTLRMGTDPQQAVADPHGRSFDHPNLYFAGSALFPTGGSGSPTLTIAALALRTARAVAKAVA